MKPLYVFAAIMLSAAGAFAAPADDIVRQAKKAGNPQEKIKLYTKAAALEPKSPRVWAGRALAWRALGKEENALADFNRAVKLQPEDFWLYAQRGQTLLALGRTTPAKRDLDTALQLDPSHLPAYQSRGEARLRLGEYDEAVADFTRVINHSPSAQAYLGRAEAYLRLGIAQEAEADFASAHTLEPKNIAILIKRATLCRDGGDLKAALSNLAAALELDPKDPIARNTRGTVYMLLKKWDQAKRDFERALALEPAYPSAHLNLAGYWWTARKNRAETFRHIELAFRTGFKNPDEVETHPTAGAYLKGVAAAPEFQKLAGRHGKPGGK